MNYGLYDGQNRLLGKYKTFDEAVRVLSNATGEWAVNWSAGEIIKGTHAVRAL